MSQKNNLIAKQNNESRPFMGAILLRLARVHHSLRNQPAQRGLSFCLKASE
jgi:hypothetical protein